MTVQRSFHLLALIVVLALVGAAVASAGLQRPNRSVVVRDVLNAAGDGARTVAWGDGGASALLVVRDDATGKNRRIELDRGCKHVSVPGGVGGAFLVSCSGDSTTWMVVDTTSGRITQIADEQAAACAAFTRIGRHWVEGVEPCNRGAVFYLNWRTGERRPSNGVDGEPRLPRNLDAPELGGIDDRRRALFVTRGAQVLGRVRARSDYAIDLAGRVATPRRFRCAGTCAPASLGGGLALWFDRDGARLEGYVLRTGRRLSWRMPKSARVAGATARRVYYTTPGASSPQVFRDLKSFRWR